MRICKIEATAKGAHDNNTVYQGLKDVPDGWVVIREGEKCPNFPFGSFEVEFINGVPYMKEGSWIPGVMPEQEPEAEKEQTAQENSVWDELDAAYQEGVDSV